MDSELVGNSGGSCWISADDRVKQSSLVAQTDLSLLENITLSSCADYQYFEVTTQDEKKSANNIHSEGQRHYTYH